MKPPFLTTPPRSAFDIFSTASKDMLSQSKIPVPIPSGGWAKWNGWQKVGVVGLGISGVLLIVGAIVRATRA